MRVYDTKKKRWVREGIYLDPNNNDLYIVEKTRFGKEKLKLVSPERYVWHNDIRLVDKNKVLVHEGDIIEAEISENTFITTTVGYLPEIASYVIINYETQKYYNLGLEYCNNIKVVGNVFDTPNVIDYDSEVSNEEAIEETTNK